MEKKEDMNDNEGSHEREDYGEPEIASYNKKIPQLLIWTYIILPIWGVITFYYLWNGSIGGWLDPGYWQQLQNAAKTTFPKDK